MKSDQSLSHFAAKRTCWNVSDFMERANDKQILADENIENLLSTPCLTRARARRNYGFRTNILLSYILFYFLLSIIDQSPDHDTILLVRSE